MAKKKMPAALPPGDPPAGGTPPSGGDEQPSRETMLACRNQCSAYVIGSLLLRLAAQTPESDYEVVRLLAANAVFSGNGTTQTMKDYARAITLLQGGRRSST